MFAPCAAGTCLCLSLCLLLCFTHRIMKRSACCCWEGVVYFSPFFSYACFFHLLVPWSGPGSIVVGLTCVCKHGFLRCLILCLLRLLAARAVYFCMFGMSASGPKVGGFGFCPLRACVLPLLLCVPHPLPPYWHAFGGKMFFAPCAAGTCLCLAQAYVMPAGWLC